MESSYSVSVKFFDKLTQKEWHRFVKVKANSKQEAEKYIRMELGSSRIIRNVEVHEIHAK